MKSPMESRLAAPLGAQQSCNVSTFKRRTMKTGGIISRAEALQILENDLLRLARERHAPELQAASPEKRKELMAQIEREVQEELRRRRLKRGYPGALWF